MAPHNGFAVNCALVHESRKKRARIRRIKKATKNKSTEKINSSGKKNVRFEFKIVFSNFISYIKQSPSEIYIIRNLSRKTGSQRPAAKTSYLIDRLWPSVVCGKWMRLKN